MNHSKDINLIDKLKTALSAQQTTLSFKTNNIIQKEKNQLVARKFNSKKDIKGINDWVLLKMKKIHHTSATKLGAIVKQYKGGDFYVDSNCDMLLSMETWTQKEKNQWKAYDEEKNQFVYNQGHDFEDDVPMLLKEKFPDYKIKDWNKDDLGLFLDSYKHQPLNIYCRPDYTLYKTNKKGSWEKVINIEVKSSSKTTKRLTTYKYQVAFQGLMLSYFLPHALISNCILFNDGLIEIPQEELENYQRDILNYVPMYWKALKEKTFKLIAVTDLIQPQPEPVKKPIKKKKSKKKAKKAKKKQLK